MGRGSDAFEEDGGPPRSPAAGAEPSRGPHFPPRRAPAPARPSRPSGVAAIRPRRRGFGRWRSTFGAADAAAFVAVAGVGGRIEAAGPWEVESVAFVRERALQARFGFATGTGAPDGALRCLVTVRGTFTVEGPPTPGRERKVGVSHTASVVFDAHTGNLLLRVLGPTSSAT